MSKLMNKNVKIIMFKMDILTFIDYRIASLFTSYLTAKGIIPEGLNSIGQFKHALGIFDSIM